jgi:hypothetical protein
MPGLALPVLISENSLVTDSSAFFNLSSAPCNISLVVIASPVRSPDRHKRIFSACSAYYRADSFSQNYLPDITFFVHIKNHDGKFIIHTEAYRGIIHHLKPFFQDIQILKASEFLGSPCLQGIG